MIYLEFFFIEKPINRNEIVIRKVIVSSHKLRCAFFFRRVTKIIVIIILKFIR